MKRICSKCGKPPTDGNPVQYVNGVGTCAKCSGTVTYAGKATHVAEGMPRKVEATGSAEVVHKPALGGLWPKRKRDDESD